MSLATHTSPDGKIVTITIQGRFDFNVHREFRQAYEQQGKGTAFVLDLQETAYMDSSALGMLLLLREHAGGDTSQITMRHCSAELNMILNTANFHQLFTIE